MIGHHATSELAAAAFVNNIIKMCIRDSPYLRPKLGLAMRLAVEGDELGVVTQRHRLHIAADGEWILFLQDSFRCV